jgi:hypothetical protein
VSYTEPHELNPNPNIIFFFNIHYDVSELCNVSLRPVTANSVPTPEPDSHLCAPNMTAVDRKIQLGRTKEADDRRVAVIRTSLFIIQRTSY